MNRMHALLLIVLATLAWPASATTVVRQGAGFKVQYETSPLFDDFYLTASGQARSVGWTSAVMIPSVDDVHVSPATPYDLHTYGIPAITVTADAGSRLSGVEMKFRGVVLDQNVQDLHWDAFLYGYRFTVDGASRTLVSNLSPHPVPLSGSNVVVKWTLSESYASPSAFNAFSFRADLAMVLHADGNLQNTRGVGFLDGVNDPVVQFDFRVEPVALGTGVPMGGTAPVPEPGTWATLAAGLVVLGGAWRRRQGGRTRATS